jgi:hypothetical protein
MGQAEKNAKLKQLHAWAKLLCSYQISFPLRKEKEDQLPKSESSPSHRAQPVAQMAEKKSVARMAERMSPSKHVRAKKSNF